MTVLEVGPPDKDAFEVQLAGDRISVAEPDTREPSGWMHPDREISKLTDREREHLSMEASAGLALRYFLPVHQFLESVSTWKMQKLRHR